MCRESWKDCVSGRFSPFFPLFFLAACISHLVFYFSLYLQIRCSSFTSCSSYFRLQSERFRRTHTGISKVITLLSSLSPLSEPFTAFACLNISARESEESVIYHSKPGSVQIITQRLALITCAGIRLCTRACSCWHSGVCPSTTEAASCETQGFAARHTSIMMYGKRAFLPCARQVFSV